MMGIGTTPAAAAVASVVGIAGSPVEGIVVVVDLDGGIGGRGGHGRFLRAGDATFRRGEFRFLEEGVEVELFFLVEEEVVFAFSVWVVVVVVLVAAAMRVMFLRMVIMVVTAILARFSVGRIEVDAARDSHSLSGKRSGFSGRVGGVGSGMSVTGGAIVVGFRSSSPSSRLPLRLWHGRFDGVSRTVVFGGGTAVATETRFFSNRGQDSFPAIAIGVGEVVRFEIGRLHGERRNLVGILFVVVEQYFLGIQSETDEATGMRRDGAGAGFAERATGPGTDGAGAVDEGGGSSSAGEEIAFLVVVIAVVVVVIIIIVIVVIVAAVVMAIPTVPTAVPIIIVVAAGIVIVVILPRQRSVQILVRRRRRDGMVGPAAVMIAQSVLSEDFGQVIDAGFVAGIVAVVSFRMDLSPVRRLLRWRLRLRLRLPRSRQREGARPSAIGTRRIGRMRGSGFLLGQRRRSRRADWVDLGLVLVLGRGRRAARFVGVFVANISVVLLHVLLVLVSRAAGGTARRRRRRRRMKKMIRPAPTNDGLGPRPRLGTRHPPRLRPTFVSRLGTRPPPPLVVVAFAAVAPLAFGRRVFVCVVAVVSLAGARFGPDARTAPSPRRRWRRCRIRIRRRNLFGIRIRIPGGRRRSPGRRPSRPRLRPRHGMRSSSEGEGGAPAVASVVFDDGDAAVAASASDDVVVGGGVGLSSSVSSRGTNASTSYVILSVKLFRSDEFLIDRATRVFVRQERILAVVERAVDVAVSQNARGDDVAGAGVADDGLGATAASASSAVGVFRFAWHVVDHSSRRDVLGAAMDN